jgi:triosephosphate isomerase
MMAPLPRRPFVAANWKMFKTRAQAAAFGEAFRKEPGIGAGRAVICPPFTALETLGRLLEGTGVALGAQDLYSEVEGAFTGEVSAGMLKEAGCTHVIIGHSERRKLFGDTDEAVNRKVKAALAAGLTPIFCVGEQLADRDAGKTEQVVWGQLTRGLDGLTPEQLAALVVAYEPVWAIGTGRNATPEQAQAVHAFIRGYLKGVQPGVDAVVPVLYGGSVKPDNIAALMKGPDVDGALVGGASLDPKSFAALINGAAAAVR